ncbi:hypothetical protein [Alkalibacillus haloalkaliphilus]|uniref:hypothetical protein n=1 Tax=Alkalibacillus haloalkaliphilus TaxID=94136 RepID=UPI0029367A1B|nr:hypothetical protein [Alkalibacillus haloalkaliphilus]MDV2582185.1 hypothetical protein [Alkalibacillus haloalkaliphilus]
MNEQEFRLKELKGEPEGIESIKKKAHNLDEDCRGKDIEAFYSGPIIILPEGTKELNEKWTVKLCTHKPKRADVDHAQKVKEKNMQNHLRELEKKLDLSKGEVEEIAKRFNKLQREMNKIKVSIVQKTEDLEQITYEVKI